LLGKRRVLRREARVAKVLIVDDEPEVAKALRRLLTRRGFEVDVATSARDGLSRLAAFSPDIVISDYRMPGMKGPELLDEVRLVAPSAARFLISGQTDLEPAEPDAGAHQVLAKPWDNDELVARLVRALEGRRPA
jgi:DNA-binding NtrC family response regulator